MSVEALFWAIEQLDELEKPQQRLLLLMLANIADPTGYAFPGVKYLARKVGVGSRMLRYHLSTLEEKGLITRACLLYTSPSPRDS